VPGRIATLDGLRAIAIAFVLVAHASGTGMIPMSPAAHLCGDLGVRIFFVISGFLITTLLMRERAKLGQISLGAFYLRRVFRIFPAFYAYLAVVVALACAGSIAANGRDVAFAATYTMNFHRQPAWSVGHLWSLAVEEQFYLVWPLAIVALGLARAYTFAIGAILVAPFVRVAVWYAAPQFRALTDEAFPCVFDALAIGCLLAIARDRLDAWRSYRAILNARWFWAIPLACVGSLVLTRPWFQLGLAMTVANVGIALALHRCVTHPNDLAGRILEHPVLVRIGTLSYSLYLWQQLFLNRHSTSWWNAFPVNIGFACLAAWLCHCLIEQPMLRLGARYRERRVDIEVLDGVATSPVLVASGAQ
jgi:peptidoglycan/LPS O-acetylase OafA/YrhL